MFMLRNGALGSSRDQLLTGASFPQVWFSDPPGDFESYLVFFLFLIKKIKFKISIYRKVAKMVSPRVPHIQVPLLLPLTTVCLSPPMNQCWYVVNPSLGLRHFPRLTLFLMILTTLGCIGLVFCRAQVSLGRSGAFLTVGVRVPVGEEDLLGEGPCCHCDSLPPVLTLTPRFLLCSYLLFLLLSVFWKQVNKFSDT